MEDKHVFEVWAFETVCLLKTFHAVRFDELFCAGYLLLYSGSRVSVCQPGPTGEGPQHCQH